MTEQEFEQQLSAWAQAARAEMRNRLGGHYIPGKLKNLLKFKVGESRKTSSHYVGFNFRRYGVFVAYGVGRGWIRQGGTVVRGSRVKKGSALEKHLLSKGYTKKDVRDYVISGSSSNPRKPVDWFDSVLLDKVDELSAIAAEFYGDYSMDKLLEMVSRMTIEKKS